MALGKRIKDELERQKLARKNLIELVPELSAQSLSNLIVRDSKRSEHDVAIAEALGVDLLWLVYGITPSKQLSVQDAAATYDLRPNLRMVNKLASQVSEEGLSIVIAMLQELAKTQPYLEKNKSRAYGLLDS